MIYSILIIIILICLGLSIKNSASQSPWAYNREAFPRKASTLDNWRQDNFRKKAVEYLMKRCSNELANCQNKDYDHYIMREVMALGLDWNTAKEEIDKMEKVKWHKSLSEETRKYYMHQETEHKKECDKRTLKENILHYKTPGTLKLIWGLLMKDKLEFEYIMKIGKGLNDYHEKIAAGGFLRGAVVNHLIKRFRVSEVEADKIVTRYVEREVKNDRLYGNATCI